MKKLIETNYKRNAFHKIKQNNKILCTGEKKLSYIKVIRDKKNKVKTGLFTCWQGYSNKWRKPKILIAT